MSAFKKFLTEFQQPGNPDFLDYSPLEKEYAIFDGEKPLLTPGGKGFLHSSKEVIRLILTDFQLYRNSKNLELSAPVLFAYWKDKVSPGEDHFLMTWDKLLYEDHFVQIKTSEKSLVQPFTTDDPLFTFSFVSIAAVLGTVNTFMERIISEVSIEENETNLFPELLKISYQRLGNYQKAAVQALSEVHSSGLVLPILFVSGEISSIEYVKGLISFKIQQKEKINDLLAEITRVKAFLEVLSQKRIQERLSSEIITEGEGDAIEFKSTLRWDIRAGKTNPAIERSCLKTISAFLNSSGGTLMIGVRDDGSIEGIETDKFVNEDKFLLHLWMLIRICLGRDFSPFISTKLERLDGKTICVVTCRPADRPVFLRQPGFDEEMYIRLGPSSNALNISEALKYVENHFSNNPFS